MSSSSAEDLLRPFQVHVPSFPKRYAELLDVPMQDYLSHLQFQVVARVSRAIDPEISRDAFQSETTLNDLLEWLQRAGPVEGGKIAERFREGRYETVDCLLRPIEDSDLRSIYQSSLDPNTTHRWRFRGRTPSPEEFRRSLFSGDLLCQYVVAPREKVDSLVGVVTAYNPDLVAAHCFIAFLRTDPGRQFEAGLMIEGATIFLQYLFDHFPLRKIYAEVPEYNTELLANSSDLFVEEGLLKDHYLYDGRMWDQHILALYRTRWDAFF